MSAAGGLQLAVLRHNLLGKRRRAMAGSSTARHLYVYFDNDVKMPALFNAKQLATRLQVPALH